jgi:hypothetical protein
MEMEKKETPPTDPNQTESSSALLLSTTISKLKDQLEEQLQDLTNTQMDLDQCQFSLLEFRTIARCFPSVDRLREKEKIRELQGDLLKLKTLKQRLSRSCQDIRQDAQQACLEWQRATVELKKNLKKRPREQ